MFFVTSNLRKESSRYQTDFFYQKIQKNFDTVKLIK